MCLIQNLTECPKLEPIPAHDLPAHSSRFPRCGARNPEWAEGGRLATAGQQTGQPSSLTHTQTPALGNCLGLPPVTLQLSRPYKDPPKTEGDTTQPAFPSRGLQLQPPFGPGSVHCHFCLPDKNGSAAHGGSGPETKTLSIDAFSPSASHEHKEYQHSTTKLAQIQKLGCMGSNSGHNLAYLCLGFLIWKPRWR